MPRKGSGEPFDTSQSVFLRKVMEDFADPEVNEITLMTSAQSAKTETIMALLAWCIAEDPGPILWVTTNQTQARLLARARLMPLLEKCPLIADKIPEGRYDKTTTVIYFPGAPLVICGADSPSNLQSTPYRYIFLDEVRSWKPGAPEMVAKRTRSYPYSYKKVIVSTPDRESDHLHRAFLAGSQEHWHVKCPDCGYEHEVEWGDQKTPGGLKWDKNEVTYVNGKWQWEELFKTVRYKCWNCDREWRDNNADKKALSNTGRWVASNTAAPQNAKSYHWNALLPWWASWTVQLKEFLEAKKALKTGAWMPLKDHINETRGQVWSDDYRFEDDAGFLGDRVSDYDHYEFSTVAAACRRLGLPVKVGSFEEVRRLMTIDVQGKGGRHYYYVIRSWARGGESRLLDAGKLWSIEALKDAAKEWYVDPDNMIFDTGAFTTELYQEIMASGRRMKAFKGDPRDSFMNGSLRQIWTKTFIDPAIGTSMEGRIGMIPLYLISRPSTCDMLDSCITGRTPGWHIHKEAPDEYRQQVTAYYRHEWTDPKGINRMEWRAKRDNHYADCERYQIGASVIPALGIYV
jgi:hypothetical protein